MPFDLQVHVRDPKTGVILQENHYVMKIGPEGHLFERPPGSGLHYDITGKLVKDTGKEKREAEAKAKADAEAKAQAEKMAVVEAEKAQILAEARAEAERIVAEAEEAAKAAAKAKKAG